MGRMKLPRAILFDLDDTILVAFGPAQSQWQRTIGAFADQLPIRPMRQRVPRENLVEVLHEADCVLDCHQGALLHFRS